MTHTAEALKQLQAKGAAFKALHERDHPFIIGNAWDAGSAHLLTLAGYEAIATTSAGCAFSLARRDNHLSRDIIMANAHAIVTATPLPVSADLEEGFGPTPEDCVKTIELAADIGLVGCLIEDSSFDPDKPQIDIAHAKDRIAAAAQAANALPFDFILTGRAENLLVGNTDMGDIIARLQAYQDAGAHALYAPGLASLDDIRTVCSAVDIPVNILALPGVPGHTVEQLGQAGAKRISVGSRYTAQAYGDLFNKAKATLKSGSFAPFEDAMPYGDIYEKFPTTPRS